MHTGNEDGNGKADDGGKDEALYAHAPAQHDGQDDLDTSLCKVCGKTDMFIPVREQHAVQQLIERQQQDREFHPDKIIRGICIHLCARMIGSEKHVPP